MSIGAIRVLTLLVPTVLAIGVELFDSVFGGPTWTSLTVHYVPQSVAQWAIGVLIAWLPKHFSDAYKAWQRRQGKDSSNGNASTVS